MKDPTSELHDAYFELLDGNVSINGTGIPVYKWERPGDETRIEIASTVMEDQSTQDTYLMEVLQDITIVSGMRVNDERQVTDDISNEVTQLVVADTFMTMDNFIIHDITLNAAELFEDSSYDHTIYRKELTFKHKIEEK